MCVCFFPFLFFAIFFSIFCLITKIKTKLFVSVKIPQPNFALFLRRGADLATELLVSTTFFFGLPLLVALNRVFKCLLNLPFTYLFLLSNKRLLPLYFFYFYLNELHVG